MGWEKIIDKRYLDMLWAHSDTMKNTSKDDNGKTAVEYMTESDLIVINFDSVKTDYVKGMQLSSTPKSCDTLFFRSDDEWYLIEF